MAAVGLVFAASGASAQETILLNNGLSYQLSNDTYAGDNVFVRNVGCGSLSWPHGPCASPGDPTELELIGDAVVRQIEGYDSSAITVSGGEVVWSVWVWNSATLDMDGGTVSKGFYGEDAASITMTGGTVLGFPQLNDTASLTMTGGSVNRLEADGDSTFTLSGGNPNAIIAWTRSRVEIRGRGFELDGATVPYGPIEASSGSLTGTLDSGEALDIDIDRDPGASIILVPEARLTLLQGAAALCLAAIARRGKKLGA